MKFNEKLYEKIKELDSTKKEITSQDLTIEKRLLELINESMKCVNPKKRYN